jgi:hypothetical protein
MFQLWIDIKLRGVFREILIMKGKIADSIIIKVGHRTMEIPRKKITELKNQMHDVKKKPDVLPGNLTRVSK